MRIRAPMYRDFLAGRNCPNWFEEVENMLVNAIIRWRSHVLWCTVLSSTVGFWGGLHVAVGYAAPAISVVQGAVSNGSPVIISGSGFGATGPNVVFFDDFEKGTHGSPISISPGSASFGQWGQLDSNPPRYSNAFAFSGNMSYVSDWSNNGASEGGRWAAATFNGTNQVYFSFWTYLPTNRVVPGTSNIGANWKWVEISRNPLSGSDYTSVFLTDFPPRDGTWQTPNPWYDAAGLSETGYGNHTSIIKGRWHRYEYFFLGSSSGSGIIQMWELNSSTPRTIICNKTNLTNLHSHDLWGLVRLSAYGRGDANSQTYHDDFYIATGPGARARVEIGNSSSYSSSTNLAVATVTSWSDTQVVATIRQGSFQPGQAAYLYVVDSSGAVNSQGYPLTIGGGAAVSVPETPSALTVR